LSLRLVFSASPRIDSNITAAGFCRMYSATILSERLKDEYLPLIR
jgi:hypothetical protein